MNVEYKAYGRIEIKSLECLVREAVAGHDGFEERPTSELALLVGRLLDLLADKGIVSLDEALKVVDYYPARETR